jgi:hypothetical protein
VSKFLIVIFGLGSGLRNIDGDGPVQIFVGATTLIWLITFVFYARVEWRL